MCVCGDRMKGKYPYFLSVHSPSISLSLAPYFGHASFGVCCTQTHTHGEPEHRQISHKTHEIIFSGTQTIRKAATYRLKEKIVEERRKKRVYKAINNGTK